MINIKNVSFAYTNSKTNQIENINLTIGKGEFILLCGKSGCGKSTLTKAINKLIPEVLEGTFSGKVLIDNIDLTKLQMYEIAGKIGSVFQNPKTQFFNLDTTSELYFGLENAAAPPDIINRRIAATIKDLNIEELLDRNVFRLSGGEKQILSIASIYALNPDIYILDEPSANLDKDSTERLFEILLKLKQQGKTILIAEHRIHYLIPIIDRIFYMSTGRIESIFTKEEFLNLEIKKRKQMGLRTIEKINNKETFSFFKKSKASPDFTVSNLSCGYNHNTIIENMSFSASYGEIIAVTGKNGAGKSTLMNCLCGLIKEKRGDIYYKGTRVNYKQRRKLSYMIMQDVIHQLFADNVSDEFRLLDKNISEEDIKETLRKLNLDNYETAHPLSLSGGQKQRLAVAVAILANKDIIIFDEPTSGLDYENMLQVAKIISELAEKRIIFIVTHDEELIKEVCNSHLELSGS